MYPNGSGSNIGTLLRLIQEDKNQTPTAQIPAADPNSPLRQTIQQPIQAPNAPGSDRVVSLRPEGVIQSGPQGGEVVAPHQPVAPVAAAGSVGPVAPQQNFSRPVGPSSAPSTPFIGTRISSPAPKAVAAPTQVLGKTSAKTPSSLVPKATTPSTSKQGGLTGAIGTIGGALSKAANIGTKILPAILDSTLAKLLIGASDPSGALRKSFNTNKKVKG